MPEPVATMTLDLLLQNRRTTLPSHIINPQPFWLTLLKFLSTIGKVSKGILMIAECNSLSIVNSKVWQVILFINSLLSCCTLLIAIQ